VFGGTTKLPTTIPPLLTKGATTCCFGFVFESYTLGFGFHWKRIERQGFS
jgi:hypothetical protein